jgi:hypothetical protein
VLRIAVRVRELEDFVFEIGLDRLTVVAAELIDEVVDDIAADLVRIEEVAAGPEVARIDAMPEVGTGEARTLEREVVRKASVGPWREPNAG